MQSIAQRLAAWNLDDPELFNSKEWRWENIDARASDGPVISNIMKGILIAIPISLSMWAGIIWALSKLF